jgi:hypothetical protein
MAQLRHFEPHDNQTFNKLIYNTVTRSSFEVLTFFDIPHHCFSSDFGPLKFVAHCVV